MHDSSSASGNDVTRIHLLRPRELEVLRWVSEGKTNWAIGQILGCTLETVKKHVHRILGTLLVDNRVSAALVYLEWRRLQGGAAV